MVLREKNSKMSRPRIQIAGVFGLLVLGGVWMSPSSFAQPLSAAVQGFVQDHCLDCHDEEMAKGGLNLEALQFVLSDGSNADRWVEIFDRVRAGEMPPKKKPRPDEKRQSLFLSELQRRLHEAASKGVAANGRAALRRLSRVEYANSLKDILKLPYSELADSLPPDGLADGYTKGASALDFSHVMLSRYLQVADEALWQAVAPRARGRKRDLIRSELKSTGGVKATLQTLFVQLKHGTAMPLIGTKLDPTLDVDRGDFTKRYAGYVKDPEPHFDGVASFMNQRANHNIVMRPFKVKQSGYYRLRVHGFALLNDHGKLLPSDRVETIAFYSPSGRLLGRCDLPPNVPTTSEVTVWLNEGEPIEYLAVSVPNKEFKTSRKDDLFRWRHFKAHGVGLQWFEMDGPLDESWPPESHRVLFGDLPLKSTPIVQANGLDYVIDTKEPKKEAEKLLGTFLSRAMRRPVCEDDKVIPLRLINEKLDRGEPFVDAMIAGYRAVLNAPAFLLCDEKPGELDVWALANRLSFFLWNSPPDAILRQAASDGRLLSDVGLREQTDRLIDDEKVDRFVEHFLDYWIDLRKISLTEPDENLYPEYNALLTESMIEETQAFFREMLRSNLAAINVVDSEFIMINQRLARLYGIPDVLGSKIRKWALTDESVRGGLLTQGSLLKITANGTTTSPVVRGTFVLSRFLGDPPPPPPPSVPAVEPDISGATTIREQLKAHRADPACATCHQKIDPPGFALESFDVMGGYRERYRASLDSGERGVELRYNGKPVAFKLGPSVDCAGELPNGDRFRDIKELRPLLKDLEDQIARHFLSQLVVYATGAPVRFVDRPAVDELMQQLKQEGYGVRSMIHALVQSELFRNK